ncbi:FAD/NAD(P)-binding domain-containing protein [Annulohypoxylon maeteangense]|uniref:FAD/NAD(P)-binding domain-containing protein n=1 Tax=Annulohypoxylon maeteangense TaxID=1927788 RepID=UPI0020075D1B|nr:FAD/NAD(P)-binding domain-containing protein [Annulohypoxylon maeteangense]KAI0881954.1 FAD/NAD(P)-binding domain-containing protein [Annulohypoxylon maeteangense]
MVRAKILFGTLVSWASHGLSASVDSSFSAADTIQRDVVVVGGGSSGTHAAIRLRDAGKTVVVVEKQAQLGGHVKTFTASSGVRVNYGPSNFQNNTAVVDWFSRFNIPLVQYQQPGVGDKYAEFSTGKELANGTLPSPDFGAYLQVLAKFPYLEDFSQLPDPIPEDLLLPFGQFVEKYNLQSVAFTIAQFATSNGNIFEQPALYILKVADAPYIQATISGGALAPATYDAQSVFLKAQEYLGSDALVSSTVSSATRSNTSVSVVVNTPNGKKLIKAKKLLVTMPPTTSNLKPLGLDSRESGIFSKFQNKAFYTVLLNQTGLAEGFRYYNAKAAAGSTYHVPSLPVLQFIWATKDVDTYWAWYSAASELPDATVKANIIKDFKTLAPGSDPQIVVFSNAGPSGLGVSADEIRNGFYKNLLALQGYRNTWYTGYAWVSDHSAGLWNHTDAELVPRMLQ